MPIEVKIPALGESISSGVLSSWKVAEGSYVEVDQPIYELARMISGALTTSSPFSAVTSTWPLPRRRAFP